jgi:hypothetical protein
MQAWLKRFLFRVVATHHPWVRGVRPYPAGAMASSELSVKAMLSGVIIFAASSRF